MAQLRKQLDPTLGEDPYNYSPEQYDGGSYAAPASHDVSGIGMAPDFNGQAPPQAPQQVGNIDRAAFQKDWMGSSGTFDDFIKSHPQYQGQVTSHNGSKDVFDLKGTNESLDLIGDVGGQNAHNWTGTGVGQNGQVDGGGGPGGMPAAFGSLDSYMQSKGQSGSNPAFGDIKSSLAGLFPNGAFNQDLVNKRTSNASDTLNRNRKSQLATQRAMLAEKGLLGSGPEGTASTNLESRLGDSYNSEVNSIYANESENADARMISALQIAAGMTEQEAQQAIDWYRAQSDNSLGQGQLGLGYQKAGQDYSLGLGNLALGNNKANQDYSLGQGQLDLGWGQLDEQTKQRLLDSYLKGADLSNKGYY